MKRRLHKFLWARPRALPRWWHMPDQFLLRYETRWSIRWLTSWPGMLWLLFPILFIFSSKFCGILSEITGIAGEVTSRLYDNQFFIFVLTIFFLWLWLLQRRTFLMFSRQRVEDLVMTRFSARQFWPALLVSPVLIPGSIIFQVIIGYTVIDIAVNASKAFSLEFLNRMTAPDVILYRALLNHVFAIIVLVVTTWMLLLCIYAATVHIASKCLHKPSLPTLIGSIFIMLFRAEIAAVFCGLIALAMATVEIYVLPITVFYIIAIGFLLRSIRRNIASLRAIDMLEILRSRADPACKIESEY